MSTHNPLSRPLRHLYYHRHGLLVRTIITPDPPTWVETATMAVVVEFNGIEVVTLNEPTRPLGSGDNGEPYWDRDQLWRMMVQACERARAEADSDNVANAARAALHVISARVDPSELTHER